MDRKTELVQLTDRLNRAAAEQDWTAMGAVDREIATLLSRLATPSLAVWAPAERQALRTLREAHRAAYERCERESTLLDERLADLCAHKDGWIAYALNESEDPA
jgi:hypothetical protein